MLLLHIIDYNSECIGKKIYSIFFGIVEEIHEFAAARGILEFLGIKDFIKDISNCTKSEAIQIAFSQKIHKDDFNPNSFWNTD